jgi:alkanesulfonate monooxygenase SsuD/methylene tetrahydromethanopterin reductase-like flavin-dependent oxidoreductase (luciferase family)
MKVGFILPGGPAVEQVDQAVLAEQAGWDGVFVWEAAYGVDAWALLAAMAVRTSRIRVGTLLSPLPWRRPWKLASQVATVDQLSAGRTILTVGIGAEAEDLPWTGEVTDVRARADLMDDGIDLLRALWTGVAEYKGPHYRYTFAMDDQLKVGKPVQQRIPIWVVGVWPRPKSMRRVLRCDGVVPQYQLDGRDGGPTDVRELRAWLSQQGAGPDLDVIAQGETPSDPAAASAVVRPWADAGCTWWLETRWEMPHHVPQRMQQVRDRLAAGPPARVS